MESHQNRIIPTCGSTPPADLHPRQDGLGSTILLKTTKDTSPAGIMAGACLEVEGVERESRLDPTELAHPIKCYSCHEEMRTVETVGDYLVTCVNPYCLNHGSEYDAQVYLAEY